MDSGVALLPTRYAVDPPALARLAQERMAELLGT